MDLFGLVLIILLVLAFVFLWVLMILWLIEIVRSKSSCCDLLDWAMIASHISLLTFLVFFLLSSFIN